MVPQPLNRAVVYYNLMDLLFLKKPFEQFREKSIFEDHVNA